MINDPFYIVFDFGGTFIKYAVMNQDGNFIEDGKYPTRNKDNFERFMDDIALVIHEFENKYKIEGIAISTPGAPMDGEVISSSSAIDCIHGPNFKTYFKERFGYNVELENDGNCTALGEYWKKDIKLNCEVYIAIGTGIGGAIIVNGKLLKGKNYLTGEFGHIIVNNDSDYENGYSTHDIGSVGGLISHVANAKNISIDEIDGKQIFELAKQGESICIKFLTLFIKSITTAIYNICYVVDPDVVVIGGAISERDDLISLIYNELLDLELHNGCGMAFNLETARFGNKANLLGALYNYLQKNLRI